MHSCVLILWSISVAEQDLQADPGPRKRGLVGSRRLMLPLPSRLSLLQRREPMLMKPML